MNEKNNQHLWSQFETCEQPAQVVFLGASNLSRSFPWAVDVARHALGHQLSIHAAMGFGRSYGTDSGFLGKKFSKIFSSRLWESLQHNVTLPTVAFVTDIGNDLAYEQPVDMVMECVEGCVTRLVERGALVTLTNLPIDALRRVSRAKFQVLRSVLFPSCRLTWPVLLSRAEELHERLRILGETRKIPIFTVPNGWYGFDPIHPRAAHLKNYWQEQFALVTTEQRPPASRRRSLSTYCRLRMLSTPGLSSKPPRGRFLSSSALLSGGTTVTLY